MRVFLTGASGYIGSAVAEALQAAGHEVIGLARSEEQARQLAERGLRPHRGDLLQPETVAAGAMLRALAGSPKPFLYTSGVWVLGSTGDRIADESSPLQPTPLVAYRAALEQEVLSGKERGPRVIVIRPADVYGRGGGLLRMLTQSARETGAARYVGDGRNRWSFVEVEDLARLYVLALEKAPAGSLFHAAHGPAVRMRELAEAASLGAGAGGKTAAWPLEEARKTLGAFADALALDQQVSGAKAERELGWQPRGRPVLEDLRAGSYAWQGAGA